MLPLLTLAALYIAPRAVRATPCVAMDINWNLYAFGLNGKDWSAGTQDSWGSGSATDVTTSGRPPFDGTSTTCYLSQFYNAIYVIDGDKANPSDVHIFDAAKKTWSTQKTTAGSFDPSSATFVLDHDTNVFYAVLNGELWDLDMSSLVTAGSDALPWNDVEATPYGSDYKPTMALAQNHIHFVGVPGATSGDLDIFVIHFSFFQPDAQAYPTSSGSTVLPSQHGKTSSFFQAEGVQQEFAYIPDDGSATYVVNVETNTTQQLAGPSTKDANAFYFAGLTSLVQVDSTGAVSYLPYNQNDTSANAAAKWSSVANLASAAPASSSAAASGTGTAKASGTGSAKPSSTSGSSGSSSGSSNSSSSSSGDANAAVAVSARGVMATGFAGAFMLALAAIAV
ncbi:hypothetical protein PENSPDRAFT_131065 [Peniophora sp. CONT]|nr:hypothetical protein PENSPDRAFT_131065 [Peniophora sp. CONT]